MKERVSSEISVRVETVYMESSSRPGKYFFKYKITILNESEKIVRLLSRHWVIMDFLEWPREVNGPGVVGHTPILEPGESFTYTSGVQLRKRMGTMRGQYVFMDLNTKNEFDVKIPKFLLVVNELYN